MSLPPTAELLALSPCPFCGGEAHLERTGHVACKTGWPCVHTAYMNYGTPEEQNAAAVATWNRRARPSLSAQAVGDGVCTISLPEYLRKAADDLRTIVAKWDEKPFAAMDYSVSQERRIIRECLSLVNGVIEHLTSQLGPEFSPDLESRISQILSGNALNPSDRTKERAKAIAVLISTTPPQPADGGDSLAEFRKVAEMVVGDFHEHTVYQAAVAALAKFQPAGGEL